MKYQPIKTAGKAVPPLLLVILVRAAIAALSQAGIEIDENTIWTIAAGGYGVLVAFINWKKNHKKTDD